MIGNIQNTEPIGHLTALGLLRLEVMKEGQVGYFPLSSGPSLRFVVPAEWGKEARASGPKAHPAPRLRLADEETNIRRD